MHELDALRGVASLAVVIYHYVFRYDQLFEASDDQAPQQWLRILGVPLFFIISGFVIPLTLDRGHRPGQSRWFHLRNFAAARFARLYPAFWVAAAIVFAAVSYFGLPGREVGWRAALANITMLPQRLGYKYIDGAYWSLDIEWMYYAMVAVVVVVGARRWLNWVLALMVVLDLLRVPVPLLLRNAQTFFLTGLLIYELRRGVRWWIMPMFLLCFLRVALRRDDSYTAGYALNVALVYAAVNYRLPLLANPVLVFAGTISYSLYLVHQNIGYIIMRRAGEAGWPDLAAGLLAFGVAVGLATLITYLVERPANSWLRGRLMVRGEREVGAGAGVGGGGWG